MVEVLASVDVALPNWSVTHLTLWSDLVDPVEEVAVSVEDLNQMEETTIAAQFSEVKTKIALLSCEISFYTYTELQISHVSLEEFNLSNE